MINWNNLHISIDKQAKIQLERYFQDLQKILEDQQLKEKKFDIFSDLENHIIDYVTNNKLESITFQDALNIIGELGPPDEYKKFSTIPDIAEEINTKKSVPINQDSIMSNGIKCTNCGCVNEYDSAYCIQCGSVIKYESNYKSQNRQNPILYVFNKNPEYLFGILSFFLLEALMINFNVENTLFNIITILVPANEFILVPGIFLYRIIKTEFPRSELYSFLSTYLLKLFTMISLILFFPNSMVYSNLILASVVFIIYPIALTKLLFFSHFTSPLNFNNKLNHTSKLGYGIFTVLLVASIFIFGLDTLSIIFFILFFIFVLFVIFDFTVLSKYDILSKKAYSLSFLPYPAFFYSIFSLILLACFFISLVVNFYYSYYLLDFFLFNEFVLIPIFFIYEIATKDSTKFTFLSFFFSYLVKFSLLLLVVFFSTFHINVLNIASVDANLAIITFLILVPIGFSKILFFSNSTITLRKISDVKPSKIELVKYCLVEGGIVLSLLLIQENSNSQLLNIIFLFFLLVILTIYFIQDFHIDDNFSFSKKKNQPLLK